MIQRWAAIGIVLVAGGLAGCNALRGLEEPEVSLVDVRIRDVTMFETSAVVEVRVTNPNPEEIRVDGAAYDVSLDGRRIGKALARGEMAVPGLSSRTHRAELHLSNLRMAQRVKEIIESRSFDYAVASRLYLRTDRGKGTVQTRSRGRVDARDFLPDGVVGPRGFEAPPSTAPSSRPESAAP